MELSEWVGRTEECVDDVSAMPVAELAATLDLEIPTPMRGDVLPFLWHWLFCMPILKQSDLGDEGHQHRGGFLPPIPLPRRLYAGGSVVLHEPVRIGDTLVRRSRVESVQSKQGKSGPLAFVKVRHEYFVNERLAIAEMQDIAYRERSPEANASTPQGPPEKPAPKWKETFIADNVVMFRYSALTFNGFRPHYDRDYARNLEGYPGLVVHAPLTATLLAGFAARHSGSVLRAITFRALAPLFDKSGIVLCGSPEEDGTVRAWAETGDGRLSMEARASC